MFYTLEELENVSSYIWQKREQHNLFYRKRLEKLGLQSKNKSETKPTNQQNKQTNKEKIH